MSFVKELYEKIRTTPHLFGKLIVICCVLCGIFFSAWALRILSHTGNDSAPVLGVILAFFGGELLALCLNTVLKEKKKERKTEHE